jgi:hypothetical protein
MKLNRQVSQYGSSTAGMPPLLVYRAADGRLMIFDGVTRATRVAKLMPGLLVRVEVVGTLGKPCGHLPTVGGQFP